MSFLSDLTIQNALPGGVIFPYAGAAAPTGWLLCNGAAVSRTVYARLFAAIGTTYGVGDGSTTFNLPNTQGVFIRGAGSQTISTLTYSGTLGTRQTDQIQGHNHGITGRAGGGDGTHTHRANYNATTRENGTNIATGIWDGGLDATRDDIVTDINSGHDHSAGSLSASSHTTNGANGTPRTGTQTHPANLSVNYIIKI
jgi:microcystin-dependent protein